jgi:fructokinase
MKRLPASYSRPMTNSATSRLGDTPALSGILVVGECLVDLAPEPSPPGAPHDRHFVALPGGGPANVALGLARLGIRTLFAGRFSRSGFGPWLRQHLAANKVDLSLSVDAAQAATLAVVTLDNGGHASYIFYGPETADWQWDKSELPGAPDTAPAGLGLAAVHTGSLATAFQPGATVLAGWLTELRHAGDVLVSFDPNVRPGLINDLAAYRQKVEGMIASAHVVKASDEDIEALYPGARPFDAARRWLEAGTRLVVVTEGSKGATAVHHTGASARCTPPAVQVADTIGAGDSFTSALLANLAHQDLLSPSAIAGATATQLQMALDHAVAASAFTCTRPGADPPDARELAAFLHQRGGVPGP